MDKGSQDPVMKRAGEERRAAYERLDAAIARGDLVGAADALNDAGEAADREAEALGLYDISKPLSPDNYDEKTAAFRPKETGKLEADEKKLLEQMERGEILTEDMGDDGQMHPIVFGPKV